MSEFDNVVPTFVRTESIHDLCSRQIARAIKSNHWLSESDSVMDFGCGIGSFSLVLNEEIGFVSSMGVDASEKMVSCFNTSMKARHLDNKLKAVCKFISTPDDLEGAKFDAIVSLKAFHHIPNPQEVISVLKTYLKPNGRLIIADLKLDDHSPVYHRSVAEPPECHGFTEEAMKTFLTTAGLKAEVVTVDVTHYLECLDQDEAKKRFEKLPAFEGRVDRVEKALLPPMICLQGVYYEKDVFPFVVACGSLYFVYFETLLQCILEF